MPLCIAIKISKTHASHKGDALPLITLFSGKMKRKEDYPIFDKSYQLSLEIFKATMKFPKSQRYVISQRLQDSSLKFIEEITLGFTSIDKLTALNRASDYLERLRILTRVTFKLNFWSFKYYERINVQINEIGKMLGGWIKKQKG